MARELLLIAALIGASGCGRSRSAPAEAAGKPLASKPFYRLDAGPPSSCARGATCEARLVLTALGDYHVNKDYPFKFVGDPGALPIEGTGTFAIDDPKHLTMTIQFRPTAAGTAKVTGQLKLSVCSDDTCEIETPTLELAIPVS
jgi:hypothetical protein